MAFCAKNNAHCSASFTNAVSIGKICLLSEYVQSNACGAAVCQCQNLKRSMWWKATKTVSISLYKVLTFWQ